MSHREMSLRRTPAADGRVPARLFGGRVAGEMLRIPLDRIDPRPDQPRQAFDPVGLEELAQSLRDRGVLQPVRVRCVGERFEIIAGERRWRAARIAGLREVPAILVDADDAEAFVEALVENIQREDLNAVERAHALRRLRETLGLHSWAEVGRLLGIGRVHVHRLLNVTALPSAMQDDIRAGGLGEKHARALTLLRHAPVRQLELWETIHRHGLSGDAALREARRLRVVDAQDGSRAPTDEDDASAVAALRDAVAALRGALAAAAPHAVLRMRTDLLTLRGRIDGALEAAAGDVRTRTCEEVPAPSEPGRGGVAVVAAGHDPHPVAATAALVVGRRV